MRGAALLLSAVLLAGCVHLGHYGARPPVAFQHPATVRIKYVTPEMVDPTCRGFGIGIKPHEHFRACRFHDVIILPNPCDWPRGDYADMACHELGHWNGWPGTHPGAIP